MILYLLETYSYRKNIKKTSTICLVYKYHQRDYDLRSPDIRLKLQPGDCQKVHFPGRQFFSTICFIQPRDYVTKEKLQQFYSVWKDARIDDLFILINKDARIDHLFDSIFHFLRHQLGRHSYNPLFLSRFLFPTIPYSLHQDPYLKNQNKTLTCNEESDHNKIPSWRIHN